MKEAESTVLNASGLELMELTYAPNTRVSEHLHDEAHFCVALQGDCIEFDGRNARQYRPSTIGYLPVDRPHSLQYGQLEMRWFTVNVSSRWLDKLASYSRPLNEPLHANDGLLSSLSLRLYQEFIRPDNLSSLVIESLVCEMLVEVSRQNQVADTKPAAWLLRAREFIDANFAIRLPLDAIAACVGIHPVHLAREFRKHFRHTVGDYVRMQRVEYACHELFVSDAPIAEIALAAGFADQSHLSRTFKRLIGTTPAEYRRVLKGQ